MSAIAFDTDGWLTRIGYAGSREPGLATLRGVIAAHTGAIPFDSLDVFLGRVPQLDIGALQAKMIRGSRGGYCYEQNLLFRTGLRALGFSVTGLSARVIRGLPAEAERPATHMALRVDLPDGAFLVDVGYGNQTPTAPLQMVPDVEQETPHEVMRLLPVDQDLVLQAKLHTGWQNVYRLAPHAVTDADYDVMNWFTATHPSSQFVTSMIVARPGADGVRHTMFNSLLSTRRAGELIDRKALPDAASHRLALAETFRLTLSDDDLAVAVTQVEKRGTRGSSHPFFT